jgi:hypothetical protein
MISSTQIYEPLETRLKHALLDWSWAEIENGANANKEAMERHKTTDCTDPNQAAGIDPQSGKRRAGIKGKEPPPR